jgi:hypothetical protein
MTNQSKTRLVSCRDELRQSNVEAIPCLKGVCNPAWEAQCEVHDPSRKGTAATLGKSALAGAVTVFAAKAVAQRAGPGYRFLVFAILFCPCFT